jgi:hypothetical protein
MYQSEAMWIAFSRNRLSVRTKIAAGKIDAVTGKPSSGDLAEKSQKLCCHSNAALARRILRQGKG